MRLKHLALLGYKTFADRVEFLFDEGIAAIVGPNGCGKSNVADAVRWVLGEQSFSLLRAKKSEDMIFSGSQRRARMGMAEATITLDNSGQWLPVEFEEVAITRRSYRSGENEYLLNGSRVRLRDITELLGKSGLSRRTYTVIGQGLIDAALSLRPQERRRLIEEAAGLTLYQSRRADALNKLEETKRNVLRVQDLTSEIEPRLRRLQRQAERTQEYQLIRADLDDTLRVWYAYQWRHGQDELQRVRAVATYQLGQLDTQRKKVRGLGERIAQVRAQQSDLRGQLGQWYRESSTLRAQSETHQRELAVAEERRRGLIQRRDELQSELAPLAANRTAQVAQVSEVERALSDLRKVLSLQHVGVKEAQTLLGVWQDEMTALRSARDKARERLLELCTQIADHESRLAQLDERRSELQDAKKTYQASCQTLEIKVHTLQGDIVSLDAQLGTLDAAARELVVQRKQREQGIEAAQERERDLREQRNGIDQRLGRLRERYDVLTRMREEGAGLYEGVRSVLQAGADRLGGVVGAVAELIDVPRELETAIEVALGGQLQNVVVETWSDAQAAIAYLKRTRGGRATFLPLDALRPSQRVRVSRMAGVLGVASELVACEPRLRPVAEYLLGRTIVCQDLAVARRVLRETTGSYQIVTLEGEQVRSSGAVTGGSQRQGRQGGMLARERERRELPRQLGALRVQREALDGGIEGVAAQERSFRDEVAVLASQQGKLDAGRQERGRERTDAQGRIDRAQSEIEWHRALFADADRELVGLGERERDLRLGLGELQAQVSTSQEGLLDLDARIGQMDNQDSSARLAERRAEMATTRQELAAKEAELRGFRRGLSEIERQIAARRRRTEEMIGRLAQTESKISDLHQQEMTLTVDIQAFGKRIEPAEGRLRELEDLQNQMETEEGAVRARLQVYESRYSQTQLQVTRREDQMAHLRTQIQDDLGLVELEMGEAISGQPLLPIEPLVSSLPEVTVLPEGTKEQIRALKRRLNRLGAINPTAPEEYQETLERYEFLVEQSQDLEKAADHLREVIAELDTVMQREFRRTFNAIGREFKDYFTRLFNGGSARLQLTDPDDLVSTGIDIVARPPGKRQHGLALLSGGERALTGAALIFAILSVSPTPFCVLDEVDAALDEANVGRFRNVLKELSRETQFVVITHNRYTIEISDIVYGVSMGADGASCVISHPMKEDARGAA